MSLNGSLAAVLYEAHQHALLNATGKPSKTTRFARAIDAQGVLIQTLQDMLAPMEKQIAAVNALHIKFALQAAERMEELMRLLRACEEKSDALEKRLTSVEKQLKAAELRAVTRVKP